MELVGSIREMRAVAVLVALALGGCVTDGGPQASNPQPQPAALTGAPPAATRAAATSEPAPEPQEPMTHERASMICWSKYQDSRRLTLDQRADLVDKCVKATMRGQKVN